MSEFAPTPRRLREAHARGLVAHSPLLTAGAALFGGGFILELALGRMGGALLAFAHASFSGSLAPEHALEAAFALVGRLALPIFVAAFGSALLVGVLQTRLLGAASFHRKEGDETPTGIAWALALLTVLVAWVRLRPAVAAISRAVEPRAAAQVVVGLFESLGFVLLALWVAAGFGDLLLRRYRLERALRMTRAERLAEAREGAAHPAVAAERRRRLRLPSFKRRARKDSPGPGNR